MATLQQLIDSGTHSPVLKCYIKRKDSVGVYEGSWVQVNNDMSLGRQRVIDWGDVSISIDSEPTQIGVFDISSLSMIFSNTDGYFNVETDPNSKWFGYLNRKFTKVKIEAGYLDQDGAEVGVATVFEGVINNVRIRESGLVNVNILSYVSILKQYDISDLSLSGSSSISTTVDAIMNQSKITDFIPFVSSVPDIDATLIDRTSLSGSYYKVLVDLAYKSNSTILLNNTTWNFKKREVSGSSVFDFKGIGSQSPINMFKVINYNDEGGDRVRVYWRDSDSGSISKTTNSNLLNKYLGAPQNVDLSIIDSIDRQSILDGLLGTWEKNKPRIEFTTKFLVNIVSPLDLISIEYFSDITPDNFSRWGDVSTYNDGSVWGQATGGIISLSGVRWMVTSIKKNFNNWSYTVIAERI